MGNEVLNVFQVILVLIFFGSLIGGYVLYLYVRGWHSKATDELREISVRLRHLKRQASQIGDHADIFLIDDPEPYGPLVVEINERIVQFEQQLLLIYQSYAGHQTNFANLKRFTWAQFWQIPWLWRRLAEDINLFWDEIKTAEMELDSINVLKNRMLNLGWDVACQSRQILEKDRSIMQDVNNLQEQGLGDEKLEEVPTSLKQWETTLLTHVPIIFFSEDKNLFDQSVEKSTVSKVHKIVSACELEITALNDIVNQWKSDYGRVNQLSQSLDQLQNAIDQIVTQLESNPDHPVNWDLSRPALHVMTAEFKRLRETKTTVRHLHKAVDQYTHLEHQLAQLQEKDKHILESHREIGQLIGQSDFAHSMEWSTGALKTLKESSPYNPENWKGIIKVTDLQKRIQEVLINQAKVIPRQLSGTITESKLEPLLKSMQEIKTSYEKVKPDYAIYYKRLREIKDLEKSSKEQLSRDYAPLKQMQAVVISNPLLNKVAGTEISRLLPSVEQLNVELDQADLGVVHAKVKKINELHKKLEISSQKWLEKIDEDVVKKKDELSKTINILQDMVSLNDPVFVEVVQLVQDQQQSGAQPVFQGQPPLLEQAHLLKSQSELWQKIVAANKAVEDIAGPVLDRHSKLEKNRQNLVGRMARADELVPEELSWPPTTIRLTNERARFRSLENQFALFKRERHKAIQLVALLSELSDNYQDLHNQVGQLLERASQEQSRFNELEHRLRQSQSFWSQRLQDNRSNLSAVSEIEHLLASIEKDFSELQRRNKSGALPYQQAYQMLRLICRKIDEATIPIGSNQIMDINGVVHRQI